MFSFSGENVMQYLAMYIGEPALNAVVIERQAFMLYTKQMKYRGVEIVPVDDLVLGLPADLVCAAVVKTMPQAGAGEPDAEAVLVVIASEADNIGSRLRKWRSAKL